jgi:hypothetical protein
MEPGFQQVPGDSLSFKEQIGSPVAAVRNLDAAYRAERKLDPVASHGKKNCTTATGTGSCR